MPVDPPAPPVTAALPHLRKIAFITGAALTALVVVLAQQLLR
jgi:hypothetical protein